MLLEKSETKTEMRIERVEFVFEKSETKTEMRIERVEFVFEKSETKTEMRIERVEFVCVLDLFPPAMYIPQDKITLREAELLHGYQIPSISSYIMGYRQGQGQIFRFNI